MQGKGVKEEVDVEVDNRKSLRVSCPGKGRGVEADAK